MKKKFWHLQIILILTLFILLSPSVFANEEYYADITININERGDAVISGITNNVDLIGTFSDLTTKQGKYWLFNLTSATNIYSDLLFAVNFPENTELNYIKSTAQISIGSESNAPIVRGILKNKNLEIIVQYHFENKKEEKPFLVLFFVSLGVIILGSLIYYFYIKNNLRKRKKENEKEKEISMTNRQRQIYLLVMKNENITQKKIEEILKLPKSSISRNVASLERKGVIVKKVKGQSNILSINNQK
jgi:uncharacterized membrane protein